MIKSCAVSNYIQRDGFVMVSNLLISHQEELGITNKELNFLIKVMKHKENYKLHDSVLDPTVSSRTLQRTRKSLVDKGILTYKVWKCTDEKGHIHTEGITYDLSLLEEKLQDISNEIAYEKDIEASKEAENYLIEFGEESPMGKYLRDWENHYGDNYTLTPYERNWYNNLSEKEQKYVGCIFDYCMDNKLFKSITPRLALFIKNVQRWDQLKHYYEDSYVEEDAMEEAMYVVKSEKEKLNNEIVEAERMIEVNKKMKEIPGQSQFQISICNDTIKMYEDTIRKLKEKINES